MKWKIINGSSVSLFLVGIMLLAYVFLLTGCGSINEKFLSTMDKTNERIGVKWKEALYKTPNFQAIPESTPDEILYKDQLAKDIMEAWWKQRETINLHKKESEPK